MKIFFFGSKDQNFEVLLKNFSSLFLLPIMYTNFPNFLAHCASADILQAEDGSTTNKMDTVNVQAATTSEANDQIVYLSIRDGQQNIRLKVPCGKDPITYAKEYLESVSDANDMLT